MGFTNGKTNKSRRLARGQCLCGNVGFEIDVPARWAWHDHSSASRPSSWRGVCDLCRKLAQALSHHRGEKDIARFDDATTKTRRSFCKRCGTPLIYERPRSPHMVNIPRALFSDRTGRQPLYHIAIEELQEWTYAGEPLVPLKVFRAWFGIAERRRRAQ